MRERALASIPDPRRDEPTGALDSRAGVPPPARDPSRHAPAQPPGRGETPCSDQRAEDWVGLVCVTLGLLAAIALTALLLVHLVIWTLR